MTSAPTLIRDPWRRLWRFFTGDGFFAAVIMLVAALLVVAALLPQTPSPDPIAYSRWLSDARTHFGSVFNVLNMLGLFTVTSSLLFRLALALLGFAATLRVIDLLDRLRQPVQTITRRSGFAAILVYSGLLIVLFGLFIGTFSDTRADDIVVQPGTPAVVPGTPYTLRLDAVENDRARIALLQQTETIAQGAIAKRQPLQSSITLYLAQIGSALKVSATRGPTETLSLQSTATGAAQTQVLLAFTPNQNDVFVAAPQANLVLRVSPTNAGEYAAQVYQSATGKDLGSQPFKPGESITVEGTTFAFQPAAYINVSAANQPSHWIAAIGLILSTAGLASLWLWPIGWTTARSDRAAQTLVRAAWLIGTLFVWGQLIAVYPYLASFDGLIQTIESGLAAWLLLSGSLITQRRARWLLLVMGSIVGLYAVLALVAVLD